MSRAAVDRLLDEVKQLPPRDREQFAARYAEWQATSASDAQLLDAARAGLDAADGRRLKGLVAKSERGPLAPQEQQEYVHLARLAEQFDVRRLQALAELARRKDQTLDATMQEIGREARRNGS